jgi:hypothetical protein
VFGLGYDDVGNAALVERLEADEFVCYWASPGYAGYWNVPDPGDHVESINHAIIERARYWFAAAWDDVPTVFRELSKISNEVAGSRKVVIVPVGPKPHILAAGLAAEPHGHVAVLAPHLGGGGIRGEVPRVEAAGPVALQEVCTGARLSSGCVA